MTTKKKYESPRMTSYQMKPASIICTSGMQSTQNEPYGTETPDWF